MLPVKSEVAGTASSLTTLAYCAALEDIIVFFLLLNVSCSSQESLMCCPGLEKLKAEERGTVEVLSMVPDACTLFQTISPHVSRGLGMLNAGSPAPPPAQPA